MNIPPLRRFLAAALSSLVLMASGSAHASFRAYLSINGNDANPCTLQAPCRLLPAALAATDADGEVWMLESGNYNTGPVAITKSVTILAVPGQLGSVVGNGGHGIEIATAGVVVTLQNLNIRHLAGTGFDGVRVTNGAHVSLIDCSIFGFKTGSGVHVDSGANLTKVNVVGSTVRDNNNGIVAFGSGRVTISGTHILGNPSYGVLSSASANTTAVHVSDSVASGNGWGFAVVGGVGAMSGRMFVTRSAATENSGGGFRTEGEGTAYLVVGGSLATNNGTGFMNAGGLETFQSRGNNTVTGNATNTNGTITLLAGG